MASLPRSPLAPIGLGILSLVLGSIGGLLFFLPILGAPISALGVLFALAGIVAALFIPTVSLRLSLLGGAVSSAALLINLATAFVPADSLVTPTVPTPWQLPYNRPYVSPPAQPGTP